MSRKHAPTSRTPLAGDAPALPAPMRADAQRLRQELRASQGRRLQPDEAAVGAGLAPGSGVGATSFDALERDAADRAADRPAGHAAGGTTDIAAAPSPGADFSQVRVHRDAAAQRAAAILHARAFTFGQQVYLGASADASVLRHELAHTQQQHALGRRVLQPRLLATGSAADIQRFIALAEPAMGEELRHDPASGEITAVASLGTPATSPAFALTMHQIIDDPTDDAEANFGQAQDRVAVGAFPQPSDMTGATAQRIDMDDIENIEAGAPGSGVAKLAHELTENYLAHAAVNAAGGATAGVDQFSDAHEAAVEAESNAAEELVGPGRRVAGVDTPMVGNTFTRVQDFETYFLVFDLTRTVSGGISDFAVSNSRQAGRTNLYTGTIDGFGNGRRTLPASGAAVIAAAAAAVAGSTTATVRIEGFTDNAGGTAANRRMGLRRAQAAAAALVAAGVADGRIHSVGRGETAFVAANDTEAHRALNRRVVIVVDRPT